MSLFLSYAHEDSGRAKEIAEQLEQRKHRVYRFEDRAEQGARFVQRIEEEISRAEGFLALVSPDYLISPWCRRERELALIRETDLQRHDRTMRFLHVAKVRPTGYADSGMLRPYNWHDLTDPAGFDGLLEALGAQARERDGTAAERPVEPVAATGVTLSAFRNREHELQRLVQGIKTPGGKCFWLVVAPPQLGKSWLLDRVSAELAGNGTDESWRVRVVDVREQPMGVRIHVSQLLDRMFPLESGGADHPGDIKDIARMISGTDQPYACLLDGAELLDRATAKELRRQIAQIHRRLQASGFPSARLAIVVAGRREEEWRGVIPEPRLAQLPLTEFGPDVISLALRDLANHMGRQFSAQQLDDLADHVHRFTEGLPALLVKCLQWIGEQNWADITELHTTQHFTEIAQPYVTDKLLAIESLVPEGGHDLGAVRDVLIHALRLLSRYRVLTLSHLAHHWNADEAFRAAVERVGWSQTDLWDAVTRTALLSRFLDEVWSAIHRPIRRLLFRHFHPAEAERALAHREAGAYVEQWMESQPGKECGIGVVERLWHEASAVALERPEDLEAGLCETAERMRTVLRSSPAYSIAELGRFVADQIAEDGELQDILGAVPGLSDRVIAIITSSPAGGSGE